MSIQSALRTFTSVDYGRGIRPGVITGMSAIVIHDACDFDIGQAKPSQLRTPILKIPVDAHGICASEVEKLATAAQDISNFGASRRHGAIDGSYEGQPIEEAVATLTARGLCVSPHDKSGKDGTFLHSGYDGFVRGEELHLQMIFDT